MVSLKRLEGLRLQAFLIPIAVVFAVLFAIPLAQSLYYSVTDFNGYSPEVRFVGLENYQKIFTDPAMLAGLGFTLLFAIGTTVIITVLAIPLAVLLNRRFFGRNVVRAVFFFPAIPSIAILGLVWGFILSPLGSGAINSLLGELGPVPWLSDGTLAQLSVILVAVWSSTGWHAILYLAYLQSIPGDYYEAARVDGATRRQSFFSITLPLLAPAVTISSLLLMTGGLKVYDLPYTLTKGGPGYATFTITQSIIQSGIAQAKFGQASALAVVFMLVVGAIVAAQLILSRRFEGRLS
ncbi:multiple sugar transport system permease protein/raffinose/stachyose/melibiose transport system permease protein [Nonomuraea solani]|uniref:Multiple sugar transport system permease protein/raffinose/stachyose/melibiose transport system permease protein n=1 Tax=Nonomuraea solani TaxID=1144553 RepID=A0A1H6EYQ0_9ACTN|nr:sugar ABC transporter permease [Nonomuraea solani]SEH02009.1 multiple sugar transport system permease protein/raffinose/stachyose/melibiose transport system permease protein [Nonomuraea solani]